MSIKALQDYTFIAKYARYIPNKKRRETYKESVERVRAMMHKQYEEKDEEVHKMIDWAYDMMLKKRGLGSQRALQFGGDPIFKHNARMFNCLSKNTQFVTSKGVKNFEDFNHGDEITVLTHTGKWKKATVKNYGNDSLNKIVFKKNNSKYEVYATKDHRWILNGLEETIELKEKDQLVKPYNTFSDFDFDSASPFEQLYWCYGFVYGDGTINGNYSMVRLCGNDVKYLDRFEKLGFISSTSLSLDGDIIVYTGKYKKESPDPKHDSPEMIRAFVAGYLAAVRLQDLQEFLLHGEKSRNDYGSKYRTIQSSDEDHIEFIRSCFPIAGVWIISESELTGQETNFGIRPYTIKFRISDNSGSKYNAGWVVDSIEENVINDEVWCLEVEDDHSFIMPNGIITGNCTVSYADRVRFFQECMYMLLCGCGVGFSVQYRHIERLPDLLDGKSGSIKYTVPDTIEGWSDAVGILVSSYFDEDNSEFPEYKGKEVKFVFDKIRPKGSRISNGGKAPGPEPLKKALENIRAILDKAMLNDDKRLKPIEVYDIVMHAADAVISGGVRRSATICIFSPEDKEMASAKTGKWFDENPQRGRSNNSVLLLRNKTTPEQFHELMKYVKDFGEPGFVWADHEDFIVNPCVEIGMYPVDIETGESGWQGCNLSTVNCAKVNTEEDFYDAVRAVTIIGTLQAGFTNFPYLGKTSEKIFRRESLLGVSGTGWLEKPDICLNPEIQRKAAELAVKTNKYVAEKIGINQAARVTCVKPEGTASCILGTASGIHPHHAKRYIRRVQANKLESIYQHFKSVNPRACEESVWSANNTDDVISFCVEVADGSKIKNQITAIELLNIVKSTQQNWVIQGTNHELCTAKWLNHNVSNTINVKPNEWDEVEQMIYNDREYFCGIALLPVTGDKDYPQAPFTTVYLPSEMVFHYGDGAMFVSGLIEVALTLWEDNLWEACKSLMGSGSAVKGKAKESWVARCKKFADKYFDGDIKKLTYCMKDIYNFKLWTELKREYSDVDYTQVVEEYDNTELEQAMACGANGCELV